MRWIGFSIEIRLGDERWSWKCSLPTYEPCILLYIFLQYVALRNTIENIMMSFSILIPLKILLIVQLIQKIKFPTLQQISNTLCQNVLNNNIDADCYKYVICHNGTTAKVYGHIKIHKDNYPLPVVSTLGTPTYNFTLILANTSRALTSYSPYFIKDSFSLVKIVSTMNINNIINIIKPKSISFDVNFLFTNTPIDLALKCFNPYYNSINYSFAKDVVVQLVNFVFNNSHFIFDSNFHKQIYECPMRSPLSPIMADLALAQQEEDVIANLGFQILLYFRFVDGILLLISEVVSNLLQNNPRLTQ